MKMVDVILKKKDGQALTPEEIRLFARARRMRASRITSLRHC